MDVKEFKCDLCGKLYNGKSNHHNKKNLEKHKLHCEMNPNRIPYKCKYCGFEENNKLKLGTHTSNCKLNPNFFKIKQSRVESGRIPHKHSDETKKKISESRIKFLKENPDKVPYRLNHSSKESYPEKYFSEVFQKENIRFEKYYQIGLYELDFCIPEKKIDLEIDGNQHYDDNRIVESDRRRTIFLEENGWDVIRIKWSDYNKLSHDEKSEFIKNLKNYLNTLISEKPNFEIKKGKFDYCGCGLKKLSSSGVCKKCYNKTNTNKVENLKKKKKKSLCKNCGYYCSDGKDRCQKCYRIDSRKVERPTLEVLLEDVEALGYCGTGRKYNVTDNAIRKWIKNYKSEGLI